MKEKTLLKLAIICSILGVCVLFVLADRVEIREADLDSLNEGDDAKITGVVKSVSNRGNVTMVKVEIKKNVTAIIFDSANVSEGSYVSIEGNVQDYKGEREILVNEIKRLS